MRQIQILCQKKAKSPKTGLSLGIEFCKLLLFFFFFTFLNFFIFEMFLHSSWGETFFMCIQDIIITVLTFYYGGSTFSALLFAPVYIGINYVLSNPALTPFSVILKLQEFNLVVLLISRVSFVYFFH